MPDHFLWRKDLSKYTLKSFGSADEIVADTNNTDQLTYNANGTNKVLSTVGGVYQVPIVSGQGATANLTAAQSGSTVLFDRAAGIIYTLPAPVVGLNFSFIVTVSVTSNSYKIITNAGTVLLIGPVLGYNTASTDAMLGFNGNGTTHIAFTQQAAGSNATGGLQGSVINVECVTSLLWEVTGTYLAGTTATTPFATS